MRKSSFWILIVLVGAFWIFWVETSVIRVIQGSTVYADEEEKVDTPVVKNGWKPAHDWDGRGEALDYSISGGIKRSDVLPEPKVLQDLPRGMGAYISEDALCVDVTRHGWLRTDALVADGFLPEFPVRVTRWDSGYYVYPSRVLPKSNATYRTEDGFIAVQAFCSIDTGCLWSFLVVMPPGLRSPEDPIR